MKIVYNCFISDENSVEKTLANKAYAKEKAEELINEEFQYSYIPIPITCSTDGNRDIFNLSMAIYQLHIADILLIPNNYKDNYETELIYKIAKKYNIKIIKYNERT